MNPVEFKSDFVSNEFKVSVLRRLMDPLLVLRSLQTSVNSDSSIFLFAPGCISLQLIVKANRRWAFLISTCSAPVSFPAISTLSAQIQLFDLAAESSIGFLFSDGLKLLSCRASSDRRCAEDGWRKTGRQGREQRRRQGLADKPGRGVYLEPLSYWIMKARTVWKMTAGFLPKKKKKSRMNEMTQLAGQFFNRASQDGWEMIMARVAPNSKIKTIPYWLYQSTHVFPPWTM